MNSSVNFKLIFITDMILSSNLIEFVKEALSAGVKAVQLREKNISAKELLELSKIFRTITGKNNAKLLINDRLDVALLSKADGLHSPELGINPKQLSNKTNLLFGRSVHSSEAAIESEKQGFDYIIFGPVYETPSKLKYGNPQGIERLRKVCKQINIPVFAVGGINTKRAKECINAGAHGVAVIRDILLSKNVKKTVEEFKNKIGTL